jgi:hypothetical protein
MVRKTHRSIDRIKVKSKHSWRFTDGKTPAVKIIKSNTSIREINQGNQDSISNVTNKNSDYKLTNRPVYIAFTNTRYGKVPNVSLIPIEDCGNNSLYCSTKCYGVRNYRMYQATRDAWSANSKHFRNDPYTACKQVENVLRQRTKIPSMFRIHVAGDFLNQSNVDAWSELAHRLPETKFLAYTKRDDLNFSQKPTNLEVMASQWPHTPFLKINGVSRNAWIDHDRRRPNEAFKCLYDINKTTCDTCKFCWYGTGDVSLRLF